MIWQMNLIGTVKRSISLLTATLIAGCATLPSFGPEAEIIESAAVASIATPNDVVPYRIVDVSAATLPHQHTSSGFFPASFRGQQMRNSDEIISVGDQLEVRIRENAENGLLAGEGQKETLLNVTVSNSGNVRLPYIDTIAAKGMTISRLRSIMLERYSGQIVAPEITVSIAATQSRQVTVLGAVESPGRIEIPSSGTRLLDLIAQVGGTGEMPWEMMVTVRRASTSARLPLSAILNNSSNNIVILSGDVVSVASVPRRFAVFGAINRPGNVEIPQQDADLAYLLAEVGGLDNRLAEASAVFVFRPASYNRGNADNTATAYRLDFSRPDALLLAGLFRLEPSDIVYIASADTADFERFVSIVLSPLFGTAANATNLGL